MDNGFPKIFLTLVIPTKVGIQTPFLRKQETIQKNWIPCQARNDD